jgi:hypothetical protein
MTGYVDTSHGETPPWTVQKIIGPYSIKRWPVKSVASPLQLPSPACVDLTLSGVDPVGSIDQAAWRVSNNPVTIMFAPNGSVDKIYTSVLSPVTNTIVYNEVRATSAIYLLVGTRESVVDPPYTNNANTNLSNISNLWVAINASTGLVVVTDMAASSAGVTLPFNTTTNPYVGSPLSASRKFARESSAMGGK